MPGGLGVHAEEILREEPVLIAVPVNIGNADAERRRELRFDRQPVSLEVIAAIQKEHRIGSRGPKFPGGGGLVSKDALDTGEAPSPTAAFFPPRAMSCLNARRWCGRSIRESLTAW